MGGDISLHKIMNDVSSALAGNASIVSIKSAQPLSELEAFCQIDDLLASLHKQYTDARGLRIKSEKDFGHDDEMTDMAQLAEDSAWCAMQTRYMEVRADRAMMRNAQSIMRDSVLEFEAEQRKENAKEAMKLADQYQLYERMHQKKSKDTSDLWFFIYLSFQDQKHYWPNLTGQHFNRLAA